MKTSSQQKATATSPATFVGASKDGTKVVFTTEQPLLNLDGDTGNDVYEAELRGGALTALRMVSRGRASGGPSGSPDARGKRGRLRRGAGLG